MKPPISVRTVPRGARGIEARPTLPERLHAAPLPFLFDEFPRRAPALDSRELAPQGFTQGTDAPELGTTGPRNEVQRTGANTTIRSRRPHGHVDGQVAIRPGHPSGDRAGPNLAGYRMQAVGPSPSARGPGRVGTRTAPRHRRREATDPRRTGEGRRPAGGVHHAGVTPASRAGAIMMPFGAAVRRIFLILRGMV